MAILPGPPQEWHVERLSPQLLLASQVTRVLYRGKTRYQSVEILDTAPFGRCLVLDGRTQSSEADEFVYHEALVQPGLTTLDHPRSVFIAGGGEGATLREALSHSTVQEVVMVDLDQEVVELCQQHLPNHHQGAFRDSRLRLVHDDAREYLRKTRQRFDLVILDITDPLEGGPAYLLYTQKFYRLARRHLTPGGLVVTQAGACGPLNYGEVFTAVHHTMASVFPMVAPYRVYVPSFGTPWGFVLAGEGRDPASLQPQEIDTRLAERLRHPLRFYDGPTHAGLFHLPKYLRQSLKEETRLITRDHPVYAT